ncbi:MAG TPA: alpha/beta hydrolase [Actinoplanes sp.]|jgi:acetyl esterase/lipase
MTGHILHADIPYAEPVGTAHLLDVYAPATGDGPFPVVMFHGGSAFRSDNTKRDAGAAPDLARRWVPEGFVVVGFNVRSSGQAPFPAQVHDVKAAIRHLRANAAEYRLDPDRIATMGTSSGGWVAAMAGVTADVPELEGDLGNSRQRSDVQAVVDLFGPTDFLQMDAHRIEGGMLHDPPDSPESALMGFPIQTDPDAVRKADPASYVSADSPPIVICHGMRDPLVPCHQSELLFAAYERAGATATLALVHAAGHTGAYLDAEEECTVLQTSGGATTRGPDPAPTYETLLSFLRDTLGA